MTTLGRIGAICVRNGFTCEDAGLANSKALVCLCKRQDAVAWGEVFVG